MKFRTEFIIEYYDFKEHTWTLLYSTYSRKLAMYQLNKCKHCFSNVKYRLYSRERIL